jgi:CO/xanthine dehydrogenase FAD-binding subunit
MSSSKVITSKFDFKKAETIEEVLLQLQKDNVKILAGGTDLINHLKADKITPDAIVYIGNIPELTVLSSENGLTVGAAVVMETVEKHAAVKKQYPALAEAVNSVGGWQIRNAATIAGNICNASPGADTVPALVVHQAEVVIAGKGADGSVTERSMLLEKFLVGPGRTALEKGEFVTAVRMPEPPVGSSSAFMRIARVTLDIAKLNCAAWIHIADGICRDAKIAVGSAAATVVRASTVEKLLIGREVTAELIKDAAVNAVKDISPITDIRSTREYRNKVVQVLVRDTLMKAIERAKGDKQL